MAQNSYGPNTQPIVGNPGRGIYIRMIKLYGNTITLPFMPKSSCSAQMKG